MKKLNIANKVSGVFGKTKFQMTKYSPEILAVVGVVGAVASVVMACKATLKAKEVMDNAKKELDVIHEAPQTAEENGMSYTEEDTRRDTTILYGKTAVKLAKIYAPAVIIGVLSIGSLLTSNGILKKRNASLAAAYTAIDKSFSNYRKGVVEKYGEEIDRELKYGIKAVEMEESITDAKGKVKTTKKTVETATEEGLNGIYSKFFDSSSAYYEDNPDYNNMFLIKEQNYCNDRLRSQGYLFLNDVLDHLDIPRTKYGQTHGWLYRPDDPNYNNFVDFGIYNMHKESNRRFVNGYEPVVLLDFNCDGDIIEQFHS